MRVGPAPAGRAPPRRRRGRHRARPSRAVPRLQGRWARSPMIRTGAASTASRRARQRVGARAPAPGGRGPSASPLQVTVKWQKNAYDVDVDPSEPPSLFKAQLFALTGVPVARQKIMVKGGPLRDDGAWADAGVKDGSRLMMLGTADAPPVAGEAVRFLEDEPDGGDAAAAAAAGAPPLGPGLTNLGNTCYLNATLQCLGRVPELGAALQAFAPHAGPDPRARLAAAAASAFQALAAPTGVVTPGGLLAALRAAHPQFAQTGPGGVPAQQDAEECWTQLLAGLRAALAGGGGGAGSPVDALFGVATRADLVCAESGETSAVESSALALKCNITGDVNHVTEGVALGLVEDREARSESLGRLALFAGSSRITAAPPYLTVQLVRFFYKADVQQKAKILRKVAFPLTLDVYDWCADSLKQTLDGPRAAVAAAAEAAAVAGRGGTVKEGERERAAHDEAAAAAAPAAPAAPLAPPPPSPHAGQPTGRYELAAVLTHKGRSADSGHYVAWAAAAAAAPVAAADDAYGKPARPPPPGQAPWIQYDDEGVTARTAEDVLALSGGGDWHMAYLLLYTAVLAP